MSNLIKKSWTVSSLYVASWNIFLHYVGLAVVDTSFTVMASMYLNVAYILESYGCRTLMVTTIV